MKWFILNFDWSESQFSEDVCFCQSRKLKYSWKRASNRFKAIFFLRPFFQPSKIDCVNWWRKRSFQSPTIWQIDRNFSVYILTFYLICIHLKCSHIEYHCRTWLVKLEFQESIISIWPLDLGQMENIHLILPCPVSGFEPFERLLDS